MGSQNISKEKKDVKSKNELINIKSKYMIKKIFEHLQRNKSFEIFKYNKIIQKRIDISINDYKNSAELLSSIIIEIKPVKNRAGNFINISDNGKKYYNIYYNGKAEKIKNCYLNYEHKVSKIKIIVDYQIKSFENLFRYCDSIESISFKKFHRNNITNMSGMFSHCSSLKKLDLSNFKTNNVIDMKSMFSYCSSLKQLDLSNFNTDNDLI